MREFRQDVFNMLKRLQLGQVRKITIDRNSEQTLNFMLDRTAENKHFDQLLQILVDEDLVKDAVVRYKGLAIDQKKNVRPDEITKVRKACLVLLTTKFRLTSDPQIAEAVLNLQDRVNNEPQYFSASAKLPSS